MTDDIILKALAEKPMAIYAILMRVNPSGSQEELHIRLLKMRDNSVVKFNIKTGKWSKAS